jgi:hypothetical protein
MRCKNCHYALQGLTGPPHRCPECGCAFDPGDPSTYTVKRSITSKVITVLLVMALLLAGTVVLAFSIRALRGGF